MGTPWLATVATQGRPLQQVRFSVHAGTNSIYLATGTIYAEWNTLSSKILFTAGTRPCGVVIEVDGKKALCECQGQADPANTPRWSQQTGPQAGWLRRLSAVPQTRVLATRAGDAVPIDVEVLPTLAIPPPRSSCFGQAELCRV